MEQTARFTVIADTDSTRAADGLVPLSARIVMRLGDEEFDLGVRTLDLTIDELLSRSPLMPVDAAEDNFAAWLFGDSAEAATAYYDALENALCAPPPVAWAFRTPGSGSLIDLPAEATPGHRMVNPAVYREVPEPATSRQVAVSRYQPLVGCWRVQAISLIPRQLLPGGREATTEYDAIARRGLPTLSIAGLEYALTAERVRQLLRRLCDDNIHVLHLMAQCDANGAIELQDGGLAPEQLISALAAGGWAELQVVVLSGVVKREGCCDAARTLMEALPIPAVICYQGQPGFRSCIIPFTERFYGSLGAGYDVVDAATRARTGIRDGGRATTPDVLAPVVHVRAGIDPPRIVAGDPGIEGVLAAAESVAVAREVLETSEAGELAETVPMTLAQVHNRLVGIADEHLHRLRRARDVQDRLLRDDLRRRPATYTVSSAIAEQLDKVLSMLPSPAAGETGSLPPGPPGIYWVAIIKRNRTVVQQISYQPRFGPMSLFGPHGQTPWFYIQRHDDPRPLEAAMLHCGDADIEAEPPSPYSRVIFDIRHWPPSVAAQRVAGGDDIEYIRLLERDIASGAVQTVRSLLRFHFRQILDRDGTIDQFPRGVNAPAILRGGLQAAGIRAVDVEPEAGAEDPWPGGCYLLEDLDAARRCLVVLRTDPDIDVSRLPRWQTVCEYWNQALTQEESPCIVHLDVWGADAVTSWRPQNPLAEDRAPSWVWNQLAQAATEFRYSMMHRLWEWWIGALPPENGNG